MDNETKRCKSCHQIRLITKFDKIYKEYGEYVRGTCNVCRWLKKTYKLTYKRYSEMIAEQDNKCKICHCDFDYMNVKNIEVDHNHKTGKVRAILCTSCNHIVGFVERGESNYEYIKEYLRLFGEE